MNNYYIRQDAIENNSIESEKLNCLVTSVSASSTDAEVPTAKCLYDITIGRDDFIVTATYNSNDNTYSVDHSAYEVILATRGGKKAYLKYENVYYPASFISGTENSSRVIYSSVFGDVSDNNLSNIRIVRYNHKGTTLTYDSSVIPTLDDLSKKQDKNFIVTTNLEGTLADQSSEAVNQQYNLGKNIYLNFLGETLIPLVVSQPGFSVYSTISGSIVNGAYYDKMIDNPTIVTILQEDTSLTFDQRSYSDVAFSGSYESLTDVPDLSLKEDKNNKVNSITSQSEDTQYPSARAVYELVKGHDYSKDYLTFVALSDGTFKFYGTGGTNTIQYSIDNGETWSEALLNVTVNVNTGDEVLWKGEMVPQNDKSFSGNDITCIGTFIGSTATYNVQGNIMSLLYGDNFIGQISLNEKEEVFVRLFSDLVILDSEPNTNIINAKNLILPATTLANYCYHSMFLSCTSLTTAPQLPATTLANYCYSEMFKDCASLINPPQLPATTLANYCYHSMFNGCISLTTAPQLPATTLAEGCYIGMFIGCTSLTTAPQLPATTLNISCYMGMFNGCTSLTTAPSALPATTLTNACYSDMFRNCTSLTQAPELPATTLADGCYSDMFRECTSLKTAPELPATTLIANCYSDMFLSCTSLTTAPQLPATTLANYCYANMFKSCTNLNCITMLATNISASNYCLRNWVNGVAATGTFVKSATMTSLPNGTSGIPTGWNVYTEEEYKLARQYQLSNKENTSNKVISLSSSSTDDQYPSAKAVYELVVNGHDYSKDYLTFVAKSSGTFVFGGTSTGDNTANTIQYSTDNGTTWSEPSQNVSINVNNGDAVLFKGEMTTPTRYQGIGRFNESTASFDIQGNIMSLLFGDNFVGQFTLENNVDAFYRLFLQTKCVDASNLILPATTLSEYCCAYMFNNCTLLTAAPELPATTLANYCYNCMFVGCSSLATAPELPATTLSVMCYANMFTNCTSLTTAPELPSTTLASSCYYQMFQGCSSLTTAPELLAPTLIDGCYNSMFYRCTSLNYVKMLATESASNTTIASCLNWWLKDVAASGTFVKAAAMTQLPTDNINGIPTGWTVYNEEDYELVRLYQLSNKENTSNKVISISSESTDDQYPSAKCVYDLIGNIENLLNEL